MKQKKILACLCLLLCCLLCLGTFVAPLSAAAERKITVEVNGQALAFDVPPMIRNGRVLVPFRAVGEALQAKVHYDANTRTVLASRGETKIELPIGQTTVMKDGIWQKTDQPAIIENGRTLIPLRLFAELFGAYVHWDNAKSHVTVQLDPIKTEAYLYGYHFLEGGSVTAANAELFSGLAYKWYTMNDAGKLITANTEGIRRPGDYRERLRSARDNDTETYMLLFRYGRNLGEFLQNESLCDAFIADVVKECEDAGYTGVDLDFEAVPKENKADLEAFVQKLADALHARGKKLAASLPAKSTGRETYSAAFDYGFFAGVLDQVTLMCYDYYPSQPMAQSALGWVEACVEYALGFFPADRVLLGIGYYGYDYNTDRGTKTTVLPTYMDQLKNYRCVDAFLAEKGLSSVADPVSGQKTYTYVDADGENHVVWYEDAESAALKFPLVEKYGLKGLAFWQTAFMDGTIFDSLDAYFDIE